MVDKESENPNNWRKENKAWKWIGEGQCPLGFDIVEEFCSYTPTLIQQLTAQKPQIYEAIERVKVGSHIETVAYHTGGESYGDQELVDDYEERGIMVILTPKEVRERSRKCLDEKLRESHYVDAFGPGKYSEESRIEIGKALGYSKFKIWRVMHPVQATVTGIVTTGAASGLGYMLYQYLSK